MIDYRTLTPFQGALKDLTKYNYARLLKSLTEFGWIVPFFVWHHNGKWFVSDGHQRLRVLTKEKIEPFELPYIEIEAVDEQEAKTKLLIISSQYGTIHLESLQEFIYDAKLCEEDIFSQVQFDAIPEFVFSLEDEAPVTTDEGKIKCPTCGTEVKAERIENAGQESRI